jgi:putative ABC transport system substrate-binding protein
MHSHPNDRPHATNTLRPEVSMNDRRHALAVAFAVALAAGRGPAGAATARQKTYRIGVLDPNAEVHADTWNEFVAELKRRGYQEGRNLVFDRRASEAGRVDLLNRNAVALAALPVDVIYAVEGTLSALAAKNATRTIPIVFNTSADPVGFGIVDSLARPAATSPAARSRASTRFRRASSCSPRRRAGATCASSPSCRRGRDRFHGSRSCPMR